YIVGFVQALFELKNPFTEGAKRFHNAAVIWNEAFLGGGNPMETNPLSFIDGIGLLLMNFEGRLSDEFDKQLERIHIGKFKESTSEHLNEGAVAEAKGQNYIKPEHAALIAAGDYLLKTGIKIALAAAMGLNPMESIIS